MLTDFSSHEPQKCRGAGVETFLPDYDVCLVTFTREVREFVEQTVQYFLL
jgi:hypothetical protein